MRIMNTTEPGVGLGGQTVNQAETGHCQEHLVRAFRDIQKFQPQGSDSYFLIAGIHGEPFRGKGGQQIRSGGVVYCNRQNVLSLPGIEHNTSVWRTRYERL